MITALLFAATCFLAYSNGANDNFKGVASLFGSETTDYRTAIAWATITTFLGSVASVLLAHALLSAFSGKGIVPESIAGGEVFLVSVATGAGCTVFLATLVGFPISTTHSLVGAIAGAGVLAAGPALDVGTLATTFLLPLLVSPALALVVAAVLYVILHRSRRTLGIEKETCVCVGPTVASIPRAVAGAAALTAEPIQVAVDSEARCEMRYVGSFLGIRLQRLMDGAHFLSAGIVSFARGLNDTPKIAALLVVVQAVNIRWGVVFVGFAIAVGGLLSARRVAITMSRRITGMNHGQGFAANLTTGLLVIGASRLGIPVSTTHVSVGALFGIGLVSRQAHVPVVRNVVLSWVATLPCAAALAALTYAVVVRLV
ncbi:MAG: inorganic phosphate transporter [Gemmatimonadetes bacterium]|nr:inorganic phosphate transporter [Gemmatimonadota bacterium]